MSGVRRSGRISKQLPILLLGTDTSGRVFSEQTHTLVLSRHGAGVVARNKFAPDEVLTLRLLDSGREADVRLVGQLGEHPNGKVYGVAFCDPDLDFWQIEFPPAAEYLPALAAVDLECCFCGEVASGRQTEIESDVFLATRLILRFCKICGQTTSWKLASKKEVPPPARSTSSDPRPEPAPLFPNAPAAALAPSSSAYASATILPEIVSSSAYAGGAIGAQSVAATTLVTEPPSATKTEALPPPAFSGGGKANRRRHVRTRVNFTACVRVNHLHEEIVECDNISKGGLCFRSQKRYEENAAIEVAVPYSPGQPAIFTPARVRRVEELPALNLFRYGVAYATSSPEPSKRGVTYARS
jgi:PilZ domain-containing protein